jgi:hypothetical protein
LPLSSQTRTRLFIGAVLIGSQAMDLKRALTALREQSKARNNLTPPAYPNKETKPRRGGGPRRGLSALWRPETANGEATARSPSEKSETRKTFQLGCKKSPATRAAGPGKVFRTGIVLVRRRPRPPSARNGRENTKGWEAHGGLTAHRPSWPLLVRTAGFEEGTIQFEGTS